mmetsp:Transcript_24980/g.84000  ORF Transcript_24980/g.84000 Transcript_24980/m.84000 type:complete len:227 (+) Transcript_24980:53-733(+)
MRGMKDVQGSMRPDRQVLQRPHSAWMCSDRWSQRSRIHRRRPPLAPQSLPSASERGEVLQGRGGRFRMALPRQALLLRSLGAAPEVREDERQRCTQRRLRLDGPLVENGPSQRGLGGVEGPELPTDDTEVREMGGDVRFDGRADLERLGRALEVVCGVEAFGFARKRGHVLVALGAGPVRVAELLHRGRAVAARLQILAKDPMELGRRAVGAEQLVPPPRRGPVRA